MTGRIPTSRIVIGGQAIHDGRAPDPVDIGRPTRHDFVTPLPWSDTHDGQDTETPKDLDSGTGQEPHGADGSDRGAQ